MASDAPRTDVPSANGRSAGASLAASRFFCSWSGGKDAYLALQRAVERGGAAAALVCMLHEDGGVSRGHGLPLALLEEQAAALGVPLVTRATTWDGYESTFVALLHELRDQGRCVLFSSHVMQEVSALCDRVVVIARGAVVAEGTPDDLRRQTGRESLEDAFVAAIGSEEGLA